MGNFSWLTSDTNKSIACTYSSREAFTVYLIDNAGNVWREDDYEGYGVFGGKDYYALLAEMNIDHPSFTDEFSNVDKNNVDQMRSIGIAMSYPTDELGHYTPNTKREIQFPNLCEDPHRKWFNTEPDNCPAQGIFYDDDDDDCNDNY